MSGLEVISPGFITLIQDTGRFGFGHQGIAQGGALDMHAYCWANYLPGNKMGCPQLEITVGQAAFRAHQDMTLALTGADMNASINTRFVKPWRTFTLLKGETLQFGLAAKGMRAYLAVKAGFRIPETFGSASTVMRDRLGGLVKGEGVGCGKPLAEGDLLPVQAGVSDKFLEQHVPEVYIPEYRKSIRLRVIESGQRKSFSKESRTLFYDSSYTVTAASNRMGCRLEGPPVKGDQEKGIVSEGIALGAIQIPANGQPIILLNDRQALGGYSKLGCVAQVDLPALAQAVPGTAIQFVRGDRIQSLNELVQFMGFFDL